MKGGGVGTMSAKVPHERRFGQWEGLKRGQRTEREKKLGEGNRTCKVLQPLKGPVFTQRTTGFSRRVL